MTSGSEGNRSATGGKSASAPFSSAFNAAMSGFSLKAISQPAFSSYSDSSNWYGYSPSRPIGSATVEAGQPPSSGGAASSVGAAASASSVGTAASSVGTTASSVGVAAGAHAASTRASITAIRMAHFIYCLSIVLFLLVILKRRPKATIGGQTNRLSLLPKDMNISLELILFCFYSSLFPPFFLDELTVDGNNLARLHTRHHLPSA